MKGRKMFNAGLALLFMLVTVLANNVFAQVNIRVQDLPSQVGTYIITEDDTTTDGIKIDVGQPGINRTWQLDQPFPGVIRRQLIVDKSAAPYNKYFPDANIVTRYVGKIGDIIHTHYFDNVEGEMYIYQNLSANNMLIKGIGIESPVFTGSIETQPNIVLHPMPLTYGKTWKSESISSVEVDTVFFGSPTKLKGVIKNNSWSIVDGFGTLVLPLANFKCLRIKSYITLTETLYLDGRHFRTRESRTVVYYWVTRSFGVLARVMSFHNEPDDRFVKAKQISRLHLFNPSIHLTLDTATGSPGETVAIAMNVTDLTHLGITAVKMKLTTDRNYLIPLDIVTQGSLVEAWKECTSESLNDGLAIELKGTEPLVGAGKLCTVRFQVNPAARNNRLTQIRFQNVEVTESGPEIKTHPGRFNIKRLAADQATEIAERDLHQVPAEFKLLSNYPNPFNPETTIEFHLPHSAVVTVNIFDVHGQVIRNLVQSKQSAGRYSIKWNGRDQLDRAVASGVYFCRVEFRPEDANLPALVKSNKMILMK